LLDSSTGELDDSSLGVDDSSLGVDDSSFELVDSVSVSCSVSDFELACSSSLSDSCE